MEVMPMDTGQNQLQVISKDTWHSEYRKRLFENRESAIVYFGSERFGIVEEEVKEFLANFNRPDILALYLDEDEFKFLKRKCRKHFGLNALPNFVTVCDNDFLSYLHIANYNVTHPGTIVPFVESLLDELYDGIEEMKLADEIDQAKSVGGNVE